jgi:hypothetical protein
MTACVVLSLRERAATAETAGHRHWRDEAGDAGRQQRPDAVRSSPDEDRVAASADSVRLRDHERARPGHTECARNRRMGHRGWSSRRPSAVVLLLSDRDLDRTDAPLKHETRAKKEALVAGNPVLLENE